MLPSPLLHFVPGGVKSVRHLTGGFLVAAVGLETGPGLERVITGAGGQSRTATPGAYEAVNIGAQLSPVPTPATLTLEVPVGLELLRPVGEAEHLVLVVQVVRGDLLPRLDVHQGPADHAEVLRGETEG